MFKLIQIPQSSYDIFDNQDNGIDSYFLTDKFDNKIAFIEFKKLFNPKDISIDKSKTLKYGSLNYVFISKPKDEIKCRNFILEKFQILNQFIFDDEDEISYSDEISIDTSSSFEFSDNYSESSQVSEIIEEDINSITHQKISFFPSRYLTDLNIKRFKIDLGLSYHLDRKRGRTMDYKLINISIKTSINSSYITNRLIKNACMKRSYLLPQLKRIPYLIDKLEKLSRSNPLIDLYQMELKNILESLNKNNPEYQSYLKSLIEIII